MRSIRQLRRVRAAVAATIGDPELHPVAAGMAARTLLLDGLIGRSTGVSRKQTSRFGVLGALLAIAIGSVLVFFTGWVTGPTRAIEGGAVERGRVVAVERFTDDAGRTFCTATAEYRVGGNAYRATTDYRSARACDAIGVKVDISYPPTNPGAGRPLFETDRRVAALLPVGGWLLVIAGSVTLLIRVAQLAIGFRLGGGARGGAGPALEERAYALLREAWTGKPLPTANPAPDPGPEPDPQPGAEIDLRQETAGTPAH